MGLQQMSAVTFKVFFFSDGPLAGRPQPWCWEDETKRKGGGVCKDSKENRDGKMYVGGESESCDGGQADIKEAFVRASSSSSVRIRAREQWTLRTLRGGIECLHCRTLSSRLSALNFFIFFIINYFLLIARIRKSRREKGRSGSLESETCVCVRACSMPTYTLLSLI